MNRVPVAPIGLNPDVSLELEHMNTGRHRSIRGEAYFLAHQGKEAATEFQKILDHQGLMMNWASGALAHLGIARAYTLQSDTNKARASYQDFLALWKDANPDIPILIAAKAEYAKLK